MDEQRTAVAKLLFALSGVAEVAADELMREPDGAPRRKPQAPIDPAHVAGVMSTLEGAGIARRMEDDNADDQRI